MPELKAKQSSVLMGMTSSKRSAFPFTDTSMDGAEDFMVCVTLK